MSKWYTADDHSAIAEQRAYKPEGDMWTLPKGLPTGVKEIGFFRARDVFAKAEKKEPQFVDVRFLPINLESTDGVSRKQSDQVGGYANFLRLVHHQDRATAGSWRGDRYLCVNAHGDHACPICEAFAEINGQDGDRSAIWKRCKDLKSRYSVVACGFIGGDTTKLWLFEYSDETFKTDKGFNPTFGNLIRAKIRSQLKRDRLNAMYFGPNTEAQIVRLEYIFTGNDPNRMSWRLQNVMKVTEEDGAPSVEVNEDIFPHLKLGEWLDVDGEAERMRHANLTEPGGAVVRMGEEPQTDGIPDVAGMGYDALCAVIKEHVLLIDPEQFDSEDDVDVGFLRDEVETALNKKYS